MHEVTGISASQRASLEREARQLINGHDRNYDSTIGRNEMERFTGSTSETFRTRNYFNDDLVEITTVYKDNYKGIRDEAFRAADANRDGRLNAQEMVRAYLHERDTNHDGNLSTWERMKMSLTSVSGMFQRFWSVETHRSSRTVYDPLPYYDDPYRPTPPRVDPRPPYYNDRPTPPRVDPRRPAPPPVYPRRDDRPAPPPVNPRRDDRPAPPPVGRSDRPAPPPVSPRNGRPAPPPVYND